MVSLRFRDARQQQQAIRCIVLTQSAGQLFRPVVIAGRQRNIDSAGARRLIRRIAGHQIVIDHPGFFVHFAALIETRHREHQIGILRIALHRPHQLVIRRGIVALLPQSIGFVDHIAVADTRQLRWRAAGLKLRVRQQRLRFIGQPRLVEDRHLIGIVAGVPRDSAADIVAHQRYRRGNIAALRQQSRQFPHVSR